MSTKSFGEWVTSLYRDVTQVLLTVSKFNEHVAIVTLKYRKTSDLEGVLDLLASIYSYTPLYDESIHIDVYHVIFPFGDPDDTKYKVFYIWSSDLHKYQQNTISYSELLEKIESSVV